MTYYAHSVAINEIRVFIVHLTNVMFFGAYGAYGAYAWMSLAKCYDHGTYKIAQFFVYLNRRVTKWSLGK